MALETTTYGPKDKKPKWQVKPFNFSKVKKTGDTTNVKREPKVTQPVVRQDNGKAQDEPIQQTTDQPVLGMGDLKQAESEGTVNFFDQKPPKNLNDLYQMPQDATKAPVYDYNKLKDLPITKKVYKDRQNDPENREPTYPISQPVETPPGSYEAADIQPQLQEEEIKQKAEIVNKINSGEINLPPFVSSLPVDMQLGYVGATYNNNPLYTSLTTLMEPLLHLDNLVRSGMNKAFSTDYKMLTPPNMSGEDEDDRMITAGTEILTSLIPLGASIKGANYLLKGVKNPFVRNMLGTGLGFVINSQPALLDNLQQGHMELKDYAIQTAKDLGTGLSFGILPKGLPLKYEIPYQTIVPTMVPVIADLVQGKPVNEKEIIDGIVSNAVLSLVMSGQLPRETKVKEVARQVQTELNKYDESQQTPELVNQVIAGLLGPARETNSETISRIKKGEVNTEKPSIEQINIPGDKSRIVVDEKGNAQIDPDKEAQPYIAPIKLTQEQYNDMKRGGMTDADIKEAQDYLNGKINRTQKTTDPTVTEGQDNRMLPDSKQVEKPANTRVSENIPEQQQVKKEPEREYKTVKLDAEDIGSKWVEDEKGNKFVVKKETDPTSGRDKYVIYKKTSADTEPQKAGDYYSEYSVNLGLRSHAEGDMYLKNRPAEKIEQQKPADERTAQEKKAEDAYSDMLSLRDEVNNVKSGDLSGRANKSNNVRLLKKTVDTYNANHPDNKAKIERTKYGTYNITINGKPLRRESVKREFNVEDKAGEIDNPNANKPYKELGAEEREVQRKVVQNILDADPSVVKNKAGFETPMKVFRKGLQDIKDDSGKEQSPEAQIVRQEMLEKTDNGKEYRTKNEDVNKPSISVNKVIDSNQESKDKEIDPKDRPTLHIGDMEGMDEGAKKYKAIRTKDGEGIVFKKNEDGEIFATNKDGEVVGFVTKLSDTETDLSVAKEYQQKGIGTELLKEFNKINPDHGTGGLTPLGKKTLEAAKRNENKKNDGQENGIENERKNLFEKMSLAEIERHVNDKAKEIGSRADYLRSDEYKELIKPVLDKLLSKNIAEVRKQVEAEKEKLKNRIITKEQYDKAIQNIKDRGRNMYTTPIDPAALKDIMVVGLYHFEQGARTLASWSKKMVKELGEKIKPHLKKIWAEINEPKNMRKFRENNPEAKVNTSGYAGRQALGYEKAKEEKKVFKNPYDQKERFEIDDSKAELKLNETWKLEGKTFNDVYNQIGITKKAWGDNNTIMLQDILIHPELYKNYPEAKRLIVIPEELKGAKAAYETRSQLIKVDYDLRADEVKSALLHEIQHAIQQAEGFAKGGNVKEFKDVNTKDKLKKELIDVASSLFDKLPEELKSDARKINRDEDTDGSSLKKIQNNKEAKAIWADYLNARKQIEEVSNSSDSGYPIETAYDQYQKLAGEIEARDVQARMDLTADQRDPNSSEYVAPYSSENIAPQDAILKYDGTESHSMKLKEEETFEQYKKRIAKQYGTVPTREEYNDAKQLQVTSDKVQPKKDESNVKAELEEVLKDVVAPTKGRTLDEMRSRTSKKKMNATANESYMGKVYSTISETIKEYEKKGLRDQSLLSRADIESTKKIYNDPEFKKFTADQKKAIVSMVKRYFKEEYKKQNLPDKNSYSYPGDGWYKGIKKHGFLQSLNVIRNMGKAGKEFAERMNIAKDDERMWHGKADALMFDMASLSKAEMNNLEAIWKAKMHENIPPMHLNDNVKNMDVKLDKYFDDIAIEMKDRAVMTKNKLTGDVYLFKPRKDYRPRVMKNDKALEKLAIEYDKNGNALRNEERARVIDHLVITGQAKDGARAAELLDGVIAENRIRKAGNVEYSRSITFPEEYYTSNPVESLHKYASAVSKRIAFIDAWGKDGSVAHQLIDQIGKDHQDYEFAKKLFKYETDQLTPSERKKLEIVNSVKGYMALTKFTPFTTLRNTFQGFLGATTRGNLKSGFVGLAKTLSPTMRRYVYESGAVADNIESLIKDIAGGEANNKIGKLTSFYLDKIGFTMTDRVNRLVSGAAGLSFYQDMLKRIKNDSVLKRRAYREFEKLGIDPEAILKRDQPEFTDAEKKLFIRNFAYDSQFSLKPQDLPLFWSSGTGKLLTQWKPWSYKMTQLIRDNVIGEIKQGNAMPLITMMAAYGLAGETASFIIDSIRSPFKYNDRKDEDENLSPIEKTSVGYLSRGEIDGFLDRLVQDLGSLGALSAYYDFARAIGYGKSLRGIGAYVGPAPGELITSIVDLATPISTRFFGGELFRSDAEDFKKMTTDTFKGIYNASGRNLPFAGTPRTLGLTRKGYDWLFKNDGPDFKDDSIIGEYYKQLDDPGKEEVKKIKQMEKDLKDFKEKVLAGPTKELQREFARKESEIKRYKDKSKVWYNYTKLKSSKEKEESTKLGK